MLSTSGKSDPIARALARGSGKGNNAAWADALSTVPLFGDLSQRHLKKVAAKATLKRYAPLTPIVRAGDPGDAFYIILDGSASVRKTGKRAVKLGPGDFFGELALLDAAPRNATVESDENVLAMRLGRAAFTKVLESEPKVAIAMLRGLAARSRESRPSRSD
jgi:CRP/FNR family transcriptional regulator, cyclic AMP receptor protein